jgi:hypothetical protein
MVRDSILDEIAAGRGGEEEEEVAAGLASLP